MTNPDVIEDDFNGDNAKLVASITALLELDDAKALVPHGLGGPTSHAYRLLSVAAKRLTALSDSAPTPHEAVELLREAVNDAAIAWCGEKDRETFDADIDYFRANWFALVGLKKRVANALLIRVASRARIETLLSGEVK